MTENRDKPQHIELAESQIRHSCPSPLPATSRSWLEVGDIMTEDVTTVCPGSPVVSAAKIMSDKNISCIIVSDNGDLSGIITETDLLKRAVAEGNDFRRMTVEQIMSSPVRSVPCNLSVLEAGRIIEDENIRRLIVLEEKRLVGIITQTDIVRVLSSYGSWKNVSEVMTGDVAVIASSVTVKEAAEVMASEDISCLVAMDKNTAVGIFTERDLLKRVIALKRNPAQTILKNVMSSPVVSISANYSIPSASKMMEKMKIRRLVVLDDGILCGVITQTDILKATKEKLQEEEENYFRLLNESRNCIYIVDLNNNITYVNPALMKLLEVTDPDELINKPFLPERFWENPHQRDRILDQLKKATVEVKELTLRTAQGKKLFVTLFSTRTKNIKGQTSGSQGVLYDITAKKELATLRKMEHQLRISEGFLRGTLESTADGILVIDEKGRVSHMNKRFAKIWDVPEELVQQRNDQKLLEHLGCWLDDSSAFLGKLQTPCSADEESFDTLYLKQGKILETYSLPLIREERFAGQVWSFRDVTDSKRDEEALRKAHNELEVRVEERTAELTRTNKVLESEIAERKKMEEALWENQKRLDLAVSGTNLGLWDWNVQTGESVYNQQWAEMLGYTLEEIEPNASTWRRLVHPNDTPQMMEILNLHFKRRTPFYEAEFRMKTKSGGWKWILSVGKVFEWDDDGNPLRMTGTHRDITERKKAEEVLEKLNTDLKSTVSELKRTNKELQEFAYITAHDLKTPLRGIGTLADWLTTDYADKFDEQGQRQIKMLVERANRADKLVDSILQYSSAGHLREEQEQVDLNTVLPEIIHEIDPPENIEITIEKELPVLMSRNTQIRQVFHNLLSNAVKYIDKEKGQIKVGCFEEEGFWKFSVADNGPGIDQKYFKKIFKIFQTLSPPDETESTGIGLSVAKKIVKLNGGRIWVESNPGEGSTFFFTIPKSGVHREVSI
jgi:PAS domain S-box-containing protein